MELLILTISQLVFSFTRTLNVRYVAQENVAMALITSSFIKIAWLVATGIGVNAMLNLDILVMAVFVISGLVGDYFSFFVKIPPKREGDS